MSSEKEEALKEFKKQYGNTTYPSGPSSSAGSSTSYRDLLSHGAAKTASAVSTTGNAALDAFVAKYGNTYNRLDFTAKKNTSLTSANASSSYEPDYSAYENFDIASAQNRRAQIAQTQQQKREANEPTFSSNNPRSSYYGNEKVDNSTVGGRTRGYSVSDDDLALIDEDQQLQDEIRKATRAQTLKKYGAYSSESDFNDYAEQGASAGAFTNKVMAIRNNPAVLASGGESDSALYTLMTDKEVSTYNYALAKYGKAAANEYLDALEYNLTARKRANDEAATAQAVEKSPILSSAASIATNYAAGAGSIYALAKELTGQEVDPNSQYFTPSRTTNAIRGTVADKIAEKSKLGSFAYQTVLSILDNAAMIYSGMPERAILALMGTNAATSTMTQAFDSGATQSQAVGVGTMAGIAEVLFEKVSLDHLFKISSGTEARTLIKNLLTQSGIEGSEEIFTEVANIMSDTLLMADKSELQQKINAYMQQGMTEAEASAKAYGDLLVQVGLAGAGGFLSGLALGGFGTVKNNYIFGQNLKNYDAAQGLVETGASLPATSRAYQLAQRYSTQQDGNITAKDNLRGGQLTRLYNANIAGLNTETMSNIESRLKGTQNETYLTRTFKSILEGNGISDTQAKVIANNETARSVFAELTNSDASTLNAESIRQLASQRGYNAQLDASTVDNKASEAKTTENAVATRQNESGSTVQAPTVKSTLQTVAPASAEIASVGENATVKLSDGTTVKLADTDFGSKSTLYEAAAKLGNTAAANTMVSGYKGGNIESYIRGFRSMYNGATQGLSIKETAKQGMFCKFLTEEQQKVAYEAGENVRTAAEVRKRQANAENRARSIEAQKQQSKSNMRERITPESEIKPGVNRDYDDSKLSSDQRIQLRVIDEIFKADGKKIVVHDSIGRDENGKPVFNTGNSRGNAFYDADTDTYHLALNSMGQAYSLITVHESIHEMAAKNREGYKKLEDITLGVLVADLMEKKGMSFEDAQAEVDRMVKYQADLNGWYTVSDGEHVYSDKQLSLAREEVVANTVPVILTDETQAKRFADRVMKASTDVRNWFHRLINKLLEVLNKAYKRLSQDKSWKQMDVIRKDRAAIQEIADAYFEGMEGTKGKAANGSEIMLSVQNSDEDKTIKEQLREHLDDLSKMQPVSTASSMGRKGLSKEQQENAIVKSLSIYGTTIDRPGFGKIILDSKHIGAAITKYVKSDAEYAAFLCVPHVIKRGIEVGSHIDHKGRSYSTVTFAAPVIINGKRGNVGVTVITQRRNFYRSHRIIMPDGTVYNLSNNENVEPTIAGAASISRDSWQTPIGSTSDKRLPQEPPSVKTGLRSDEGNNTDIRFSLKDVTPADTDIMQEVQPLYSDANHALQRSFASVENIDIPKVNMLARSILRRYSSTIDSKSFADDLTQVFAYMSTPDVVWSEARDVGVGLMKNVLAKSSTFDEETYKSHAPVRDYLRTTGIAFDEGQKAEAAAYAGSWNDYRRALFGRVLITNSGKETLDGAWQSLASMGAVDSSVKEGDMPRELYNLAQTAYAKDYTNEYGYDEDGLAYDMLLQASWQYLDSIGKDTLKARQKLQEIRQSEKKQYQERYAALRDEKNTKIREAKAKYRDRFITYKQQQLNRRRTSFLRGSIEDNAKELRKWLSKPNVKEGRYVPESLRGPMVEFLGAIDFTGPLGGVTKQQGWAASIDTLRNEYNRYTQSHKNTGEYAELRTSEDFSDVLNDLADDVKGNRKYAVSQLDSVQLEELDYVIKNLKAAVRNINRMFKNKRYATAVNAGDALIQYASAHKEYQLWRKSAQSIRNFLNVDMLDSYSFFEQFGEAGESISKELDEGMQKSYTRVRAASEFFDGLLKKYGFNERDVLNMTRETRTFKLDSGRNITLTIAQVMDIYNLSKRPQALMHLLGAGIEVSNIAVLGKPDIKQLGAFKLTDSDIASLVKTLTKEQAGLADDMMNFLSTTAAEWGNEVSREWYGVENYREAHYWPIKVSGFELETKDPAQARAMNAVANSSFTKATSKYANNTAKVVDVFQAFSDHIAQMSTYNGLALPIDDVMKWMNYKQRDEKGNLIPNANTKLSMERVAGSRAVPYLINLVKDLNGLSSSSYSTELASKLLSNFKKSAVAGKLRVVIQQPTAIARALSMIDGKYMLQTAFKKRSIKEMQDNAPIAWWKAQGNYEIGVGRSLRSVIIGDDTDLQRLTSAAMEPAGKADDISWAHIWEAVKLEISDKQPSLSGDEYMAAVADRFSDIVNRTQVVDTVLHRSQAMRSKDIGIGQFTAFMSEPTKSYNMLRSSIMDVIRSGGSKAAKKQAIRAVMAWLLAQAFNAAVLALHDTMRDRDEEDKFGEMLLKKFGEEMLDNVNPLAMIPFAKEIASLIEGYDSTNMTTEVFTNLWNAVTGTSKQIAGTSKKTWYDTITTDVKAVSDAFGMPFGGMMSSLETVVNAVFPGALPDSRPTVKSSAESMYFASEKGNARKRDEAIDKISDLYLEKVDDYVKEGSTREEAQKKARSSVLSTCTSVLKPYYQAAKTASEKSAVKSLAYRIRIGTQQLYAGYDFSSWDK